MTQPAHSGSRTEAGSCWVRADLLPGSTPSPPVRRAPQQRLEWDLQLILNLAFSLLFALWQHIGLVHVGKARVRNLTVLYLLYEKPSVTFQTALVLPGCALFQRSVCVRVCECVSVWVCECVSVWVCVCVCVCVCVWCMGPHTEKGEGPLLGEVAVKSIQL